MRVATRLPAKCTGCYSTKRDQVHIDFASAFDGPLIDPARPRAGHIEWLVLCQDCVERANALLPTVRDDLAAQREQLVKAEEAVADNVTELQARIEQLESDLRDEQNYSARLEGAFNNAPARKAKSTPAKAAA